MQNLMLVNVILGYIQSLVYFLLVRKQDAPLLCWFYWRTYGHVVTHCVKVYNIMLFNDALSWVSECDVQLYKYKNQYVADNVYIVAARHN